MLLLEVSRGRTCYQRGIKVGCGSICSTPATLWAEDWARWWHHPVGGQCLSEGPCLTQEPSVRGCAILYPSLAPNPSVPSLEHFEPGTLDWLVPVLPVIVGILPDGPPYFRSTASQVAASVSHGLWPSG